MPSSPLLSVVIPTYNRPQMLERAILSALAAAPERSVEIIVVPNGADSSWKSLAERFDKNLLISWEPIPEAQACKARNHGLFHAKGKYVRFLDDDDFLLPEAVQQILDLEHTGADLNCGLVISIDQEGNQLGPLSFPESRDFVCASASMTAFRLPVANLFRRSSIGPVRWREDVDRAQDYVWMLDLAAYREWEWQATDLPVGVWYQHDSERTSTVKIADDHPTQVIDALTKLCSQLSKENRLTDDRRSAIADALWHHIHSRFPFSPFYWHKVAMIALSVKPDSRPSHPIFKSWPLSRMNPLSAEWLLYPARRITTFWRELKLDFQGRDYRRRL